ncbi:MAG: hypothetical protein IT431_01760 [Phycisphaerales bacterium]|nr:hypothetical protein [Phycisphaerales bacterium]
MNGQVFLIVSACIVGADARAADTTIDFDDLLPGYWSGGEYAGQGVTFSTAGSFLIADDSSFDSVPILVAGSVDGSRADAPITARFWRPGGEPGLTDAVRFNVIDFGGVEEWSARIYGVGGELLETVVGTGGAFGDPHLVEFTRPSPDIHAVTFLPSVEYEGIDTLVFGAVVPAPATLGLWAGAIVLGGKRRPRRAR